MVLIISSVYPCTSLFFFFGLGSYLFTGVLCYLTFLQIIKFAGGLLLSSAKLMFIYSWLQLGSRLLHILKRLLPISVYLLKV